VNRWSPLSRPRLVSWPGITVPIAVLVIGASAGAWLATTSDASTGPSYRLVPVVRTTMQQTLSSTGTIEPATTSTLSFSASGQVTAVEATVGEHVRPGQTLATMTSATLQIQVAQAKATLATDQARLYQDEASGASSAELDADQASVSADESALSSAGEALSGATLTSPIDGVVAAVGYTAGQQVNGGAGGSGGAGGPGPGDSSSVIAVVSASDVIDASVDASVVDQIKTGDRAAITAEGVPGPVSGTVASVGLAADTSSGVARFPVVVDVAASPSGLYAGAAATLSIIYRQLTDVLAVPAAAVSPGPGGQSVVQVMENGHQAAKDVTTGLTAGGLIQITGGLTAGQQVAGGPGGG
jgi:membrane fusion protein, macrolide-specific efflux system